MSSPTKISVVKLDPKAILPQQAHPGDAGWDLFAINEQEIAPGERQLIPTGLTIEIPLGMEAQVRPRSGLALKFGITVLNTPGTIDAGYRGEVGVILINLGQQPFSVTPGLKIAQLVFATVTPVVWQPADSLESLSPTTRGIGGFGSTN